MGGSPSSEKEKDTPAPEVLKPQTGENKSDASVTAKAAEAKKPKKLRRGTYRPSHKATFIGLSVVVAVLAINAGIFFFLMRAQAGSDAESQREEVIISTEALDKLGVSRNPVDNLGTELIVGPDSRFNGTVTVGGDMSVAGQLKLNNKFLANDASFSNLEAGNTSLGQLNVNGDTTTSNLNVREQMVVAGQTRLQGPVTVDQLLTINNNLNVAGSLAVGGTLSVANFQTNSMVVGGTLTVGGKIITRGAAPSVSRGPAVGSNGTVSISGNDTAGTVAVNTGLGAGNGVLAYVSFRNGYARTPRVVITGIGPGIGGYYLQSRSASGFTIAVSGSMSPGGYAFDYIVMQ